MGFDRFDTRLSLKATLGATCIYAASIALLGIYPLMAGLYRDRLGLGLPEVGWVLGVEQSGAMIASPTGWLELKVSLAGSLAISCKKDWLGSLPRPME